MRAFSACLQPSRGGRRGRADRARRDGTDQRPCRRLFRQGVRHRVPRLRAQRRSRARRTKWRRRCSLRWRCWRCSASRSALAAPLVVSVAGRASSRQATGCRRPQVRAALAPVTGSLAASRWRCSPSVAAVAALAWSLRGAAPRCRRRPARPGLGLRLPAPDAADAIHRLFLRPAADDAVSSVHRATARRSCRRSGYFPAAASYASDSGDPFLRLLFAPTFRWFSRVVAPPQRRPARPHPCLRALCRGDAGRVADLGKPLTDAPRCTGSSRRFAR